MSVEKKFFVLLLAVAMLATVGCSRKNKQPTYAPAATGIAPAVDVSAPAPVARRSSGYIK